MPDLTQKKALLRTYCSWFWVHVPDSLLTSNYMTGIESIRPAGSEAGEGAAGT